MALIVWGPQLSVKVKEIDDQHRKLVSLVNNLHDAMKEGRGKDIMKKTLAELADYTIYHFSTEEKLFQKYAYPKYPDQKREHDKLTAQVLDLKKKVDSGASVVTMEVMNFLKDWLSSHIMGADMKGGEYLNSKGVL
jgi:hemerythrin